MLREPKARADRPVPLGCIPNLRSAVTLLALSRPSPSDFAVVVPKDTSEDVRAIWTRALYLARNRRKRVINPQMHALFLSLRCYVDDNGTANLTARMYQTYIAVRL